MKTFNSACIRLIKCDSKDKTDSKDIVMNKCLG